jgi:homogentisate phytyltransferase/homogentisate geranylgeranyltransferase
MIRFLLTLWKFSRPHTVAGTSLSIVALFVIALDVTAFHYFPSGYFILALVSCLAGNIYIVGLNQIEDVDIDRINKPDLPIPSGRLSLPAAKIIVVVCGIISLGLAFTQNIFLILVVVISLFLGTLYSLPPVRLKRFSYWAAFSILTVRGLVINLGIYLYFINILTHRVHIPSRIWALALFMFAFSLMIAWFKDIPDVEGDRQFRIMTFAVRLGQKTLFHAGTVFLSLLYIGMILCGIFLISGINKLFFALTHFLLLMVFIYTSRKVDSSAKPSMIRHYQFIWRLFYLEYIFFPLACVLY